MGQKERICFYCKEVIDPEKERGYFKAIINGNLEDFHRDCYKKHSSEKVGGVHIKVR